MAQNQKDSHINRLLTAYEQIIARLVLYCLTELPFPVGLKKTIDVLKGNKSTYAINHGFNKLKTFSVIPGFTRDQISDIIDIMINAGFVSVENIVVNEEELPVLKITQRGAGFLNGKSEHEFVLLDAIMDKDVADISEEDQDLYYKLKLARRQLAEEIDIPAFMVCSNTVLRNLCIKKPMENRELEKIKGVGPEFMENYSRQFLYVIRQYVTREKNV